MPAIPPLLALLVAVVAGLAQALQVLGVPEQRLVTTVRGVVVSDQIGRVGLDPLAAPAGEQIPDQHRPAQLLPACGLVPGTPRLGCIAMVRALPFVAGRIPDSGCQRADPRLEALQPAHMASLRSLS